VDGEKRRYVLVENLRSEYEKVIPILILAIFILLGCTASEDERVHQTLNRREEALQKRDLPLYLSCISKAYQDRGEDFGQLHKRIEGYFKTFDQIRYTCWDRSVHIEGDGAWVTQQFHLETERQGRTNRYSAKETLFLKREGNEWRIIRGL
jgi:ketosteroid isomerase-like protein